MTLSVADSLRTFLGRGDGRGRGFLPVVQQSRRAGEPARAAETSLLAGRPQGRRHRHHGCPHHSGHPGVMGVTEGGSRLQAGCVVRPVVSNRTEAWRCRKTIKENEVKVHGA